MSDPVAAGSNPTDPAAATPAEQPSTLLADPASEASKATEQPADKAAETSTETPSEKPVVPEEYAEFVMPEGVALDAELGTDLKSAAKEMGLTQDQAQKLADLGAKQALKFQTTQAEALDAARKTWETDAKSDKEFGGDKFNENLSQAKKAMDAYASPELKTLLNQTGLGSHPEFIRLMWKAGQAISEDRLDVGREAPTARKAAADRLYGNTK